MEIRVSGNRIMWGLGVPKYLQYASQNGSVSEGSDIVLNHFIHLTINVIGSFDGKKEHSPNFSLNLI